MLPAWHPGADCPVGNILKISNYKAKRQVTAVVYEIRFVWGSRRARERPDRSAPRWPSVWERWGFLSLWVTAARVTPTGQRGLGQCPPA